MTANPLAATRVPDQGPAYVAIIPMASAVPGSQWTIASGYGAAEDAQVHTLSEIVLKLAATNFIVNSLIRTIVLIVNLARGAPNTGLTVFLWLFWVSWAFSGRCPAGPDTLALPAMQHCCPLQMPRPPLPP